MDLGKKIDLAEPASPVGKPEPKISYPSFTLNDKSAEAFLKEYPCELGGEIACTVKLKVTNLRHDEWGKSVGFDIQEIDDMAPEESEDADNAPEESKDEPETKEGDEDESKALGYKRPKKEAVKEAVKANSSFLD